MESTKTSNAFQSRIHIHKVSVNIRISSVSIKIFDSPVNKIINLSVSDISGGDVIWMRIIGRFRKPDDNIITAYYPLLLSDNIIKMNVHTSQTNELR